MGSSVNMFNTGKSALFASKTALSTTGHNIANVNTKGYSRQRVEQTTMAPQSSIGSTIVGTGVKVTQVARINDDYLVRQLQNQYVKLGAAEEKDIALSQAEAVFNEINSEGFNNLLSRFFNDFRKLGNEPESEALRMTVKESGEQVAQDFHRIFQSVQDIQKNVDQRILANVRQANQLMQRVAGLNGQIKRLEITGGQTGDLRDQRDLLTQELSEIIDVAIGTNEKGEYILSLKGVGPLVSGELSSEIYTETSPANDHGKPDGLSDIFLKDLLPPKVTYRLNDLGRLGGLVESRDHVLGKLRSQLNEMAVKFTEKVNEVHRQGFGTNGTTGLDFFKSFTETRDAADRIQITDEIKNNLGSIATGLQPGSPGDNRNALRMAELQFERFMNEGQTTLEDFFNASLSEVATTQQKNKTLLSHEQNVVGQLQKFRESISGVSLDEETTNLVQYQHAFDAAAKVIKIADEILDTILNLRRG